MSDANRQITHEELVELQKKFSEIKHGINNALAVMMALSEMSQRRPDYAEKLSSTVLTKAPQIVSSLQEFTALLNEKAGVTVTVGFGGYSKAFGGGNRSSLNPYIGARLGYAYLEANYFEVAAELGVELVKQKGVLWTVSARPMGLVGSSSQAAVEVGSSLGLAF